MTKVTKKDVEMVALMCFIMMLITILGGIQSESTLLKEAVEYEDTSLIIPHEEVVDEKICDLSTVECEDEEDTIIEENTQENAEFEATGDSRVRETSAYTSTVGQTDSTPCISASGDNICDLYAQGVKIVASNAFPLGSKIYVEGYGEAVVLDRMNSRYQNTVDVYFGMDTQRALQWGRRNVTVYPI